MALRSESLVLAVVVVVAVVGLLVPTMNKWDGDLFLENPTGSYIRKQVKSEGEPCGPHDICMTNARCIEGTCRVQFGAHQMLPGQLCTLTIPCKYGYHCINNRCQLS